MSFLAASLLLLAPSLIAQSEAPYLLFSQQQPSQPQSQAAAPATPSNDSVPLPEVAGRLNDLDRFLRLTSARLTEAQNLNEPSEQLKASGQNLRARAGQLETLLGEALTIRDLKEMKSDWQEQSRQLDRRGKPVMEGLAGIEEDIRRLETEKKLWELTQRRYRQEAGTKILAERINNSLAQIENVLQLSHKQRQSQLVVQDLIAQQTLLSADLLDKIDAAERRHSELLFQVDHRPLWQIWSAPHNGHSFFTQTLRTLSQELLQTFERLKSHWTPLFLITLILVSVSFVTVKAARKLANWPEGRTGPGDASLFFDYPDHMGLFVAIGLFALLPLPAPAFLGYLVTSALFIFFLSLVPRLLPAIFQPLLYLFTAVYFLSRAWSFFVVVPLLERLTSVVTVTATIAIGFWLLRPSRLKERAGVTQLQTFAVRMIRLALGLLAGALIANLFGYFALSKMIVRSVVGSVFSAVRLYVLARVAGALGSLLLRSQWAQRLASIRLRGDVLWKWTMRLLACVLAVTWSLETLRSVEAGDLFMRWLASALAQEISVGEISFRLWDVVIFGLVLGAAYAFSRTVEFFLQEDVLPRFSLRRGLPNAILTMVHYCILLAGFLMAMAAARMSLNRFTVLAGAFGVGIGFGLQTIFNNLASGLILLFERPIHMDDLVEINGIAGNVRHIGIRASIIRTVQGANVIVPNSHLVSNQVTNWTYLDNATRRIDLKIRVARDADPERIIKILSDTAVATPGIEREPKPLALFSGFGDNTLDFELRCWTQVRGPAEIESSIFLAVASELRRAGIEVPIPQREVHLKSAAPEFKQGEGENVSSGKDPVEFGKHFA